MHVFIFAFFHFCSLVLFYEHSFGLLAVETSMRRKEIQFRYADSLLEPDLLF